MNIKMKAYPKKDDRICIVGAGIAGVYMAYLLKKRGYNNIVLIEKNDWVGGKCHTQVLNQIPHDLGGSMFDLRSYKDVMQIIKEYHLEDEIIATPIEMNNYLYKGKICSVDDILLRKDNEEGKLSIFVKFYRKIKFYLACKKYIRLHKKIFPDQQYPFKDQPDLKLINMTFYEFLKNNDLLMLANFFRFVFTFQYTYLETTPALYGLIWCHAEMIEEILESTRQKRPFIYRLKHGFQPFVEKLAEKSGAKIWLNFNIKSIVRNDVITLTGEYHSQSQTVDFDFLIIACGIKKSLAFLDATDEEKTIFSTQHYTHPVMSVFTAKNNACVLKAASNYWYDIVFPEASSYKMKAELIKEHAKILHIDARNEKGEKERVYITFEPNHGQGEMNKEKAQSDLKADLAAKGFEAPRLLAQCSWDYFPAFDQEGINKGYPWKILAMQGNHKTWYIGDSVSFESIRDVMKYDQMLINALP